MKHPARKSRKSRSRFQRSAFILWMAALILWGGGSRADAQSALSTEEIYLDPITVTATRTPQKLSDVADSVEVFSLQRIESILPGDVNDFLVEATGGLLAQSGGRGGVATFRLRGSEDNFTSVMLDGFKLTFPNGDTYDFSHLSPEWIGSAEVLKGPQSPLYGSDAAAGVVNLLPDVGKPGEARTFRTSVRHGAHSTYEEVFRLKGGTENSGYMATLSRLDTDGRFPNDGYYRTVGTVGLDHFFSDKAQVRFLYYLNRNRRDVTSNSGATNTDFRLQAPLTDRELNAYQRNTAQLIGTRAQLRPAAWLEYVPRLSLYLRDTLYEDRADALDDARPFFSPSRREASEERLTLDNQFNVRLSGKQLGLRRLRQSISTLGFEWEEEKYFEKESYARRAGSFYAHQQLQFQGGLTLAGGVRVDDFDVGKDETTGKISASYQVPRTGTRVRGAVGEGVKRPAFFDLFDVFGRGNPNLKSEKQESWEAGFDQFIGSRKLRFSATYYENEVRDLIAYSFLPFPNGLNYENISKVRMRGAEFSLSLVDFHHFSAHASFNTMDTVVLDDQDGRGGANFVEGEELLRRPNWWWSGSIAYHPERWKATLRVNQVSERPDSDFTPFVSGSYVSPRTNNPGFTKIDLALSLHIVQDRVSMFDKSGRSRLQDLAVEIKVSNLLDADYDDPLNYNAPGIQWFGGVRLTF